MDVLAEIRRVIDLEARIINDLRPTLGSAYEEAVRWIFDCRGKVVVTGVGKSGVIAQKIAATMVSTGTPALFLHGADGMHGDVGIIKKEDIVLAVGKSGESEELLATLPIVRKIGAKVIRSPPSRIRPWPGIPIWSCIRQSQKKPARSTWPLRAAQRRPWWSATPWPWCS